MKLGTSAINIIGLRSFGMEVVIMMAIDTRIES